MVIEFGSGVLFGKAVAGNLPTLPTPVKFGVLQEVTVDFKADLKKLYGQYQLAVATARGKLDVTLKGKLAVFDPTMLNQLYFAQDQATGYDLIVDGETLNVNANTATVTSMPIVTDWGVQYKKTGQQLTYQPNVTAVTQGQYNVNLTSGQYTVDEADGTLLKASYTYSVNSGVTITIANQLMGYAPELSMLLYNRFRSKYLALQLNDVTLGTINIPTKLEDFWIADFDGSANADDSGVLGSLMLDSY